MRIKNIKDYVQSMLLRDAHDEGDILNTENQLSSSEKKVLSYLLKSRKLKQHIMSSNIGEIITHTNLTIKDAKDATENLLLTGLVEEITQQQTSRFRVNFKYYTIKKSLR